MVHKCQDTAAADTLTIGVVQVKVLTIVLEYVQSAISALAVRV
jgi:hypothetical protein